MTDTLAETPPKSFSEQLNHDCFCIEVDEASVWAAVSQECGDNEQVARLMAERPHLMSATPVFVARKDVERMSAVVKAVEAVAQSPAYQASVLAWAPEIAQVDHGPRGALMGYDFHLTPDGPRLIEVNTNAGGAFINALLAQAQVACCPEVAAATHPAPLARFEQAVRDMVMSEWRSQRGDAALRTIAIVDEAPEGQYLYPEFLLAKAQFEQWGLKVVVADPVDLRFDGDHLLYEQTPIDLVYNRLVDFSLSEPVAQPLHDAYVARAVVVTPNPRNHALLADKRNLTILSDPVLLSRLGLADAHIAALSAALRTTHVTEDRADELWAGRKSLFFKPAAGHAGKAVYRGDKLTRGVWSHILASGDYLAQDIAPPSERDVMIDGDRHTRKMDVRLFTYAGQTLLIAARLYSGQTTNFRTPGGGFAPVIVLDR